MSGVIRVKRNGTWAPARGLYVKQSGSWTPAEKAFIKRSGAWVQIYPADAAIFDPSPSDLDFIVYKTFTSTSQRLTINNTGTDTLTINNISVSQISQFVVHIDFAGMNNSTSNISILPGQSKYIDVTVTGNTEGDYTSYINFDYSVGVLGTQSSRVAINTSVQPQYATVSVSPAAVSYSTYYSGPVPNKILRIYNNGNGGVLTINSITSASGLTDISEYGLNVASDSYIEVTITAPTGRSVGTHGDTIYINTSAGNETVAVTFTVVALSTGENEYTVPGSYTWVVPTGITSINAIIQGGGGGGGGSTEVGDGGGGGGGGSGGYRSQSIVTTPGETLLITVGAGGTGAPFVGRNAGAFGEGRSTDGGPSIINAVSGIVSAGGGFGGLSGRTTSTNRGPGFGGAGGSGGSPAGVWGETGTSGSNDSSSTYGGGGGSSPLATGGAPGTPGNNGYRGSGGGGASAPDRTSPYNWAGGNGGNGYVRISW